jgi:hypothetical protein
MGEGDSSSSDSSSSDSTSTDNQSSAETARLAAQNAGESSVGNITLGSNVSAPSSFSFSGIMDGLKTAAYNVGQVGLLANPATGPFVLASKIGAATSLGTSISNFFSGVNTDHGGTFGGSTLSNADNGAPNWYSSGAKNGGFSLSSNNPATINAGVASSGGFDISGLAPSLGVAAYSPSLDATVSPAKTNVGGSLQAVAPTQTASKAADGGSTLATLAALASIFAVFKA